MARLQKKKTESHKSKQKQKQKEKEDISVPETVKKPDSSLKAKRSLPIQKKKAAVPSEPGMIEKSITFLKEVKAELKKVTWPTRNQTIASTIVVIILVSIIASFLGIVDVGLKGIIRMVLR